MSNPVKVEIEKEFWQLNHKILIASKENSNELLNMCLNDYKEPYSKKERAIISMYENEISQIAHLINYSEKNNGVPF